MLTGGKERPDVLGQALREKNRHWDFLLKEMMWMADDFQQERKRHMVRRWRVIPSIHIYTCAMICAGKPLRGHISNDSLCKETLLSIKTEKYSKTK